MLASQPVYQQTVYPGPAAFSGLLEGADVVAHDSLYIDGAWAASSSERAAEYPATRQVIGRVPAGDGEDAGKAVAAAKAALTGWSTLPPAERASHVRALHTAPSSQQGKLPRTIVTEMGAPARIADKIQTQLPSSVTAG